MIDLPCKAQGLDDDRSHLMCSLNPHNIYLMQAKQSSKGEHVFSSATKETHAQSNTSSSSRQKRESSQPSEIRTYGPRIGSTPTSNHLLETTSMLVVQPYKGLNLFS